MVKIKYNGSTIASLEAGQTARLHTKDASLDGDIIITVPADMGGNEGGEEEGLAAGLYETGTSTLKKSWDDLLAEGIVHVEDGSVYTNYDGDEEENASSSALAGDLVLPDGIITLNRYAFACCSKLTSVVIPDSVTSIGSGAFYVCSLRSIAFGENSQLTSIGIGAFEGSSLTSIEIPDSVTSIGSGAFCTLSLRSIAFGENSQLTSIGNEAFYGCSGLTNIVIPASVTYVGDGAFFGSGLTSITFKGTPSEFDEILYYTFEDCTNLTVINVPWSEGEVEGAPWGAENATINYNYTGE